MENTLMIESDRMDRIERTLIGVEKAVVELATLQKESAKREERYMEEYSKREDRLSDRVTKVEEQVQKNTNTIWKFTGGISVLVFCVGVALKFL